MKPYPKYKPSGVPWLGDVPEHWDVVALKRRLSIANGSTPKSDEPSYWGGPIQWITPEDLGKVAGKRISETKRTLTDEGYASCGTQLIPEGSIVLSTRAPIGSIAIAGTEACTNQGCRALVPTDRVVSDFAYYSLVALTGPLQTHGRGTTFLELSAGDLSSFHLPFPSSSEQLAIAAYLDTETVRIDTLVAEKWNLIDLLREYRQSVITEAVTKGLKPDVQMKKSGVPWLGDIPAHWQALSLRRALEGLAVNGVFKKGEDFGEGVPLVNVADLFQENFVVDTENLERVRCDENETQRYGVNEGDIFLVRSSLKLEGIARFAIVQAIKEETVFECHVVRMRPDAQKCAPMFLAYYLNSSFARQSLVSRAKTTTMTTIDQSEALATPLLLPPPTEQTAIAAYLDTQTAKIDGLIAHVEKEIELLRELRAATITDAVLGRIDLRDYTKKNKRGDKSSELQPAL